MGAGQQPHTTHRRDGWQGALPPPHRHHEPHFWLGHAQDRKAQDHRYSIAEFRQDIRLGKEAIEAGVETPIPPCPWQTTYCQKVLELITSDRRCRDCTLGQRLLGIADEEQLTASNAIL